MATEQAPINEDDDLFNFDDLNVGSSRATLVSASPTPAPAPAPAAAVPPAAVPARAPVRAAAKAPHVLVAPVPAAAPSRTPADHAPQPTVAAPPPAVHPAAAQLPLVRAVEPKIFVPPPKSVAAPAAKERGARKRPGFLTISLLSFAALLNIGLAGIVWNSMSKPGPTPKQAAVQPAHADPTAVSEAPSPPSPWKDLEIKSPSSTEGESTLAIAADEIHRGEYERARTRLYSLLAVIDRFDLSLRANLAARAQLLAADAYREQADAVERQSLAALESQGMQSKAAPKHP